MAFQFKTIFRPSWFRLPLLEILRRFVWIDLFRAIFRYLLITILSILFFSTSFLFLSYSAVEIAANAFGVMAPVADIQALPNMSLGKYRIVYEKVGLFQAVVGKAKKEKEQVCFLVPFWANGPKPNKGDMVRVWPSYEKPWIAVPVMRDNGWVELACFVMIGLIMLGFAVLVWMVPTWSGLDLWAKLRVYPWKSLPGKILRLLLVVVLFVLFLAVSLLFFTHSAVGIITNFMGVDAQVADVTSLPKTPIGKYRLIYEDTGLFKAVVEKNQKEYGGVFCLYPAWPNNKEPNKGDSVKVWPSEKPMIAAPEMQGTGWIVSVFFLMIGLVMFESLLLALTIR